MTLALIAAHPSELRKALETKQESGRILVPNPVDNAAVKHALTYRPSEYRLVPTLARMVTTTDHTLRKRPEFITETSITYGSNSYELFTGNNF